MVVVREGASPRHDYRALGGHRRDCLAGTGLQAARRHLTFGPGVTSQVVSVLTARDVAFESTETVIVRLSAPTLGVTLGTPFDSTLSIADGGLF